MHKNTRPLSISTPRTLTAKISGKSCAKAVDPTGLNLQKLSKVIPPTHLFTAGLSTNTVLLPKFTQSYSHTLCTRTQALSPMLQTSFPQYTQALYKQLLSIYK